MRDSRAWRQAAAGGRDERAFLWGCCPRPSLLLGHVMAFGAGVLLSVEKEERPSPLDGVVLVSALAAFAGYGLFGEASPRTIALVFSFAAGAILTLRADTMMPEALGRGGKLVGLATPLGFGVALAVSALE